MKTAEVVLLKDKRDRLVYSRSNPACRRCIATFASPNEVTKGCAEGGTHRRGFVASEFGSIHLCTDDPDVISSSKLFKKEINFYSEMLGQYVDIRDDMHKEGVKFVKRLIHNITSLNAHHLQDLYLLVPQDSLTGTSSAKNQLELVEKAFEKNTKELASGYLRLLKNAIAIKSEINMFRNLYSEKDELRPKFHFIHKVLKNVSSIYFQEFQSKNISVSQELCQVEVLFDYESVSVALHHLFQNAVKYSMRESALDIKFLNSDDTFSLILDMTSLPIYHDEIELIFQDDYSGRAAKALDLAGDGSGMGIAKKLLEINDARIEVVAGAPTHSGLGTLYAKNEFAVVFPLKRTRKVK